jgi:glycolate oxidase iron-sulfur subunit
MLILEGCVQPSLAPSIDAAMARVLDRVGVGVVVPQRAGGCCGALAYHLNAHDEGLDFARRNIDAWWPEIALGAEAVVVTASGCGVMVKDYGQLLRGDARYASRAARISALARDTYEVVAAEWERIAPLLAPPPAGKRRRVAIHAPCTLQHGLKIRDGIEALLEQAGYETTFVPDSHLCCGSAGTYSILQPELAGKLRTNKLQALESGEPDEIATANIGCLAHLQTGTRRRVRHWIELIDERLR